LNQETTQLGQIVEEQKIDVINYMTLEE